MCVSWAAIKVCLIKLVFNKNVTLLNEINISKMANTREFQTHRSESKKVI